MNSAELYDIFRSEVVDTAKPYLWTDEDVFRYMNEAYRMFVRLIGGIPDVSGDATVINVTAGDDQVDLHPSILRIMDAWNVSDNSQVKVINQTDLPMLFTDPDYKFLRPLMRKNSPGPIRFLLTGQQRNKGQVIQIPIVDEEIQMSIYRLPLVSIVDDTHALDEVDEHHHNSLLYWMKHLAYLKQDAETFNQAKSDDFGDKFNEYCILSKAEWNRYKHKPRIVAYGGP